MLAAAAELLMAAVCLEPAAATAATLTAGLGTGPGFPLGMWAWLRSSSQDPMVAARLANRPLRPTGASEGGRLAGGWTSTSLFDKVVGVLSGTVSEESGGEAARSD